MPYTLERVRHSATQDALNFFYSAVLPTLSSHSCAHQVAPSPSDTARARVAFSAPR